MKKPVGEDDQQEAAFEEQALMQVEILKVPGQDKYCVDFQRKGGSTILFYNYTNKYMDLMRPMNNAALEDEEDEGAAAQQQA